MERARAKAYSSVWIQGVTFLPFRHTRQGRRWWWLLWVLLWMACSVNTLCFEHLFNLKPGNVVLLWLSVTLSNSLLYSTFACAIAVSVAGLRWNCRKEAPNRGWWHSVVVEVYLLFLFVWIREGFFLRNQKYKLQNAKNLRGDLVNWNVECEKGGGLIP